MQYKKRDLRFNDAYLSDIDASFGEKSLVEKKRVDQKKASFCLLKIKWKAVLTMKTLNYIDENSIIYHKSLSNRLVNDLKKLGFFPNSGMVSDPLLQPWISWQ